MALEINEIGIRMRVYGDEPAEPPPLPFGEEGLRIERERAQIVRMCVRQVLEMLQSMEER